jgi:hypothetical protein
VSFIKLAQVCQVLTVTMNTFQYHMGAETQIPCRLVHFSVVTSVSVQLVSSQYNTVKNKAAGRKNMLHCSFVKNHHTALRIGVHLLCLLCLCMQFRSAFISDELLVYMQCAFIYRRHVQLRWCLSVHVKQTKANHWSNTAE